MNIGSFGVDVYSAQFFSGLSEAPCLLIPLVRLGRQPLSMLALLLSGAACFLSLLLSRYEGQSTVHQSKVVIRFLKNSVLSIVAVMVDRLLCFGG